MCKSCSACCIINVSTVLVGLGSEAGQSAGAVRLQNAVLRLYNRFLEMCFLQVTFSSCFRYCVLPCRCVHKKCMLGRAGVY